MAQAYGERIRTAIVACGRLATPGSHASWRPAMCGSRGMASRPRRLATGPSCSRRVVCRRLRPLVTLHPLVSFVKRHPLVAFFVLAYSLTWGGWVVPDMIYT